MTTELTTAQISTENTKLFVLAGKATFTIVSPVTGNRFTYRVTRKEVDGGKVLHFVKVLTGSDNTSDYSFLGTIFDGGEYRHGARSSIGSKAPSALAFAWFWSRVAGNQDMKGLSVHHEGRCGRCARALTVPSSIESGFGPECIGKVA